MITHKEFLNTTLADLAEKHGMELFEFINEVYPETGTMMYGSVNQYNRYIAWLANRTPLAQAMK